MAFADWDTFTNDGLNVGLTLDGISPLIGTNSLLIEKVGNPANFNRRASVVVTDASGLAKGETRARLRTLWSVNTLAAGHGVYLNGMQDAEDLAIGFAQTWYACVIIPSDNTISIRKFNGDMSTAGTVLNSVTAPTTIAVDTIYATEFLWYEDLPNLGATLLSVKFGLADDYSDLAPVAGLTNFINSTSPYTTSVAEGLGWSDRGNAGLIEVRFDNTELYQVAPL